MLGVGFDEEIKWIEYSHLGDEIHLHAELARGLLEYQPRKIVRLAILLPVEEVLCRFHPQRIGKYARAAVRGRTQPHHLRTKRYQPVIAVVGDVIEGDVNGHVVCVRLRRDGAGRRLPLVQMEVLAGDGIVDLRKVALYCIEEFVLIQ